MTAPRAMTFSRPAAPPPTPTPDQDGKAESRQAGTPSSRQGLPYDPITRDLLAGMGERRHRVVRRVTEPAEAGGARAQTAAPMAAAVRPPVVVLGLIGAGAAAVLAAVLLGRTAPSEPEALAPAGGVSPAPLAPDVEGVPWM